MPIPTRADYALSHVAELSDVVLLRLKTWLRAGPNRDPGPIRAALREYANAVQDFVDGGEAP